MPRVKRADEPVPQEGKLPVALMLDSGAYTAWSKGESIDIQEYIAYIKDNKQWVDTYVNLDVIPGKPNQRATAEQVDESARLSYENLKIMKKAGLRPIPVYHMGERYYWLEKMMDAGWDYIGISPATEAGPNEIRQWLDWVFTRITDEQGVAKIKTHGFGVASFDLLKRYPWETCDATSWALTAAYGSIYVPIYRNGVPSYAEPPIKMTVSVADDKAKKEAEDQTVQLFGAKTNERQRKNGTPSDHIDKFGPMMRERVKDFLENHVGTSIQEVQTDYVQRARAIVYFYLRFEKAIGNVKFRHHTHELA